MVKNDALSTQKIEDTAFKIAIVVILNIEKLQDNVGQCNTEIKNNNSGKGVLQNQKMCKGYH